jgi:hypothetical protein
MRRVRSFRPRWPRSRLVRVLAAVALALLVGAVVLDVAVDEPLRRLVERRMNERMVGYDVRLGALDFHVLGGSIDLEGLIIRQSAYPDPPVLDVQRLTASVEWPALLRARLVGELVFERPRGYINLVQLRQENRDEVPLDERGWQQAFTSIYPLEINELRIVGGSLVYEDSTQSRPLEASSIDAIVRNIRNVLSREGVYPSDFHLEAWVFDRGRAVIDGAADLLARPFPGLAGRIDLHGIELDYFEPIVERYGLSVRSGLLDAGGRIEYGPTVSMVELDSVVVHRAAFDYRFGTAADERAAAVARRVAETAREVYADPQQRFRIERLVVEDGEIGFVNVSTSPEYRLWISAADLVVENLSDRPEDGPGRASLAGRFMDRGPVAGELTFYPEGDSPNFEAAVEIIDTPLPVVNSLLEAHAGIDVAAGIFTVYTEVRVRDGRIDGYVKPLLRDVDVYDPRQDRNEGFLHKVKEKLVGGIAALLKNRPRDQVATVARFSGPVENPDANTLEIIGKLIQNAFIQAIRPGFLESLGGGGDGGKQASAREGRAREQVGG